jgi:Flp pilus assembly protein TadD
MGLVRKEYPAVALEKLLTLKTRYPGNASILAQLGVAYADSGNLEEAARSLMQAAKMEPNNPQHYFNMGVIAERMKDRLRAIAYYEKALEVDAVYGTGRGIDRDTIYDRLARLRG